MQLNLLKGYPDYIGRRFAWAGWGTGPASYVQSSGGGDPIALPEFQNYIDTVFPAVSVSGNYRVDPIPSAGGARSTWQLRWIVVSTGAEVAAGVNLSGETVQLGGFGGRY